jgi:transposase
MSTKLNENQLLAIPLVAQGVSGKNVAKKIQVTEETVSRWKKLPEFQAEVNALLKECRDETQHKLRSLVNTALEVIKDELENKNSDQRITIALKILQNMKLNTYLYEEIGSSKAESVKSKMWNEDFAEKFI